ncbi:hypothetical protein WA026_021736 [Henosepilachna vigintioctopunctata]|uniref:Transposase n=1 Tax=Henosepilachna vigintioctopunctata TaxID=420089 RepID=A0AAW1TY11_9CUCU
MKTANGNISEVLGDLGFHSVVDQDVGVHRTTANKTIRCVMSTVVEQSHNWIRFPTTAEDMTEAKVLWQRHFRLPSVIGALDYTQIEIQSLGCTVTFNALEQFTSISAEWPGSVHDADGRVWRNSHVRDSVSQYHSHHWSVAEWGPAIVPTVPGIL